MNSFINHTLMMLEDMGMPIRYPDIRHVFFSDDGTSTVYIHSHCIAGNRVNIEQNPKMKFMIIFTILDFYIDTRYPELEGLSFSKKYQSIPHNNDFELVLREIYRIAKVIRNSLVHSPSSVVFFNNSLDVNYKFRNTDFGINTSLESLKNFYTLLIMYIKGDLGDGSYFLGIMRSIYKNILTGISYFSDEFGSQLNAPSIGLNIKPYAREIAMNPSLEINGGQVKINIQEINTPEWQGIDFYIEHNGYNILVPLEALNPDLTIEELDLINNWRCKTSFPPIMKRSNS